MKRGKAVKPVRMSGAEMAAWDRIEKAVRKEIKRWKCISSQSDLQDAAPFVAVGCVLAIRNLVSPLPPRKRARKVK